MRYFLVLAAAFLAGTLQANIPTSSIEEFIGTEWPASGAPGMAYAVVDGDNVHADARGATLAGGEVAITPDTRFLIGSVTKSFTAIAIMQLVEEGRLDLDAQLHEYIDEFKGQPAEAITLRQLLNHTSGLSTVQGNARHAQSTPGEDDLADHVARIGQWELAHEPGTVWEYSNANYHVLGRIIEIASDEDYITYVETRILAPLGMENSSFSQSSSGADTAIGHRPWLLGNRPFRDTSGDRVGVPAGGLFSSVNDMSIYLAMMMNGKDDIITAESKAQMLQPANAASPFYGLGWFLDVEQGSASHGGLVPGTQSLATLLPSERKGAIVLVNANGGIGFNENIELRNGISARALGLEYTGEVTPIGPRSAYLLVMLLPLFFVASIGWAWWKREAIRAKSGLGGMFSKWFPVLAMAGLAGMLIWIIPAMFGGSIDTLLLFQPDFGQAMVASAILGQAWAVFRLAVAYTGKPKAG